MRDLIRDLKFTFRSSLKSPAFVLTAVVTLALGIGVNTSIFSVVNAVLLRPLPVTDPDRLVDLYTSETGFAHATSSFADYQDFRDESTTIQDLAGHTTMFASLDWEGQAELIAGALATWNYFDVLGVRPLLGRFFLPGEDRTEGTHPVTVLGHRFWERRFAGDPGVLGQTIKLNGTDYTIVGVGPADFQGVYPGLRVDIWIPTMMVEAVEAVGFHSSAPSPGETMIERRGRRWLFIKGRLSEGASIEQAQAEMNTIMARLGEAYPESNDGRQITLVPTSEVRINPGLDGAMLPVAAFLLAVVGIVLLIACANVANMFLARASSRRGEVAIRLALGTGRGRLIRQLLTESLTVSLAGGSLGVLLSLIGTRLLVAYQPPVPVPITLDVSIDGRVLLFSVLVSIATGAIFGLTPALAAVRTDLVSALKSAGRTGAAGGRAGLRGALVISQVALSLVLLIGAMLIIRSLDATNTIDLGFEAKNLAVLTFDLDMHGYSDRDGRAFYDRLSERVRALPDVVDAGVSERLPFSINIVQSSVFLGTETLDTEAPFSVDSTRVGRGYFSTIGAEIIEGRDFSSTDTPDSPPVAIVSEAMARRFWPAESAVGDHFTRPSGTTYEIIGVAADYKVRTVGEEPRPFIHYSRSQAYNPYGSMLVQTRGPASPQLPALRRVAEEIDPNILFLQVTTLEIEMATSLFGARAGATLLAGFGLFGVFLAAVGLYGVISYSVGARTREVGTRMALGASRADVIGQFVREGMRLVGIGILIGAAAAAAVSRVLASLLYGISPLDPISFVAAASILGAVALAANLIPAGSASRIDPMRALGSE